VRHPPRALLVLKCYRCPVLYFELFFAVHY
jgi:hypothetical protein